MDNIIREGEQAIEGQIGGGNNQGGGDIGGGDNNNQQGGGNQGGGGGLMGGLAQTGEDAMINQGKLTCPTSRSQSPPDPRLEVSC